MEILSIIQDNLMSIAVDPSQLGGFLGQDGEQPIFDAMGVPNNIFFLAGAGLMFLLTLPFGLDYTESSLAVCIYAVPIICTISLLPTIWRAVKVKIPKFKGKYRDKHHKILNTVTVLSAIYFVVCVGLCIYFANEYPYSGYQASFDKCYNHLMGMSNYLIAHGYNIDYYDLNVIIYMLLFPLIVFFNLFILRIVVVKSSSKIKFPPIPRI